MKSKQTLLEETAKIKGGKEERRILPNHQPLQYDEFTSGVAQVSACRGYVSRMELMADYRPDTCGVTNLDWNRGKSSLESRVLNGWL
jgi:hypothetical protein